MLGELKEGYLGSLCGAYADFLRRQRGASSALTSWPRPNARGALDFAWVGSQAEPDEKLMTNLDELRIGPSHPLLETVARISATVTLNPYEREALYGYPYVVGRIDGRAIRAPLFVVPLTIEPSGRGFILRPGDDRLEFNQLPFMNDREADARDLALSRVAATTPSLPLSPQAVRAFLDVLQREMASVVVDATLGARLVAPPTTPPDGLHIIDQAAVLVAPRASYFLASDLEALASGKAAAEASALVPLLAGATDTPHFEITPEMEAKARLYFPFPSNRAQRRAAMLIDDDSTRVVRLDGPPGTGKSLTIANLVCHLVASGKSVLVTSQKDKALEVVDAQLRELDSPILPMTLLRRDKRPLLERLALISKSRSLTEVDAQLTALKAREEQQRTAYQALHHDFHNARASEASLVDCDRQFDSTSGVRRLLARFGHRRMWRRTLKGNPRSTDALSGTAVALRSDLIGLCTNVLRVAAEQRTASESRAQRQNREELAKVVRRSQSSYRNYSLFDRLKEDVPRAKLLLRSLPAWVMTPDDVARLFPCVEDLFDVVIVDEGSQVDLPSILPILYRGHKVIVCGDLAQMQPRRFAFVADTVARSVWQKHGVERYDPDGNMYPTKQSLLDLAGSRAEEAVFLDEHFRCLPSIINFSNERWYGSRMRIMTDETRKKFGAPTTSAFTLHHVENGSVRTGTQENEAEAQAVVDQLKLMLDSPDYEGASIGVIALFDEQASLIEQLITAQIPAEQWPPHDLVAAIADAWQGDERDVILYSLSYDAASMTQQQLSPRMSVQAHVQGLLNVLMTRPRHEVHVFHSAPVAEFTFAGGRASVLSDWLQHARQVQERGHIFRGVDRGGTIDSEFEGLVAEALSSRGYTVTHQYPACGFWIDLVVERPDLPNRRLAVECDGDYWHLDEHQQMRVEDLERESILERAGWSFVRIPYSKWGTVQRPN